MFAVDRGQPHPFFLCQLHHQLAAGNQRFLVCQSHIIARLDGAHRRQQSCHTHQRIDDHILLWVFGSLHHRLHPAQNSGGAVLHRLLQFLRCLRIGHHRNRRMELPNLLFHQLPVGVRRQRIQSVTQFFTYLQALGTDGTGGTQNRNYLTHPDPFLCCKLNGCHRET